MEHVVKQTIGAIKVAPQTLATALAVVFLVLPATPIIPIPTVGGHAEASNCDGLRTLVSNLHAQLDAAWVGGPGQNNDDIRRIMTNVRLAEQSLAECETGCPLPLAAMAFFFGVAATAASVAAVIIPEPTSSGLGVLSAYYSIHATIWGGMCIYMALR